MSKKGRDRYTQLSWGFGEWVERHADQLDTESVAVMAVLMGWSEANWSGVFLVNPLVLQRRTLLGNRAQVMAALAKLEAVGFLSYCEDTRLVWLKAMAERHCGGAADGKVMNAWPILGALGVKDAKFFDEFWERCRDPLGLDQSEMKAPSKRTNQGGRVTPPPPSPLEGAPSTLPPPRGASPTDPPPSPLPGGDRLEVRGKREEARASHAQAHTHAHANVSHSELAEEAMGAWLDMELEDRAKVLVSRSLSEIPPGLEDHVATMQGAMHRVIAHYIARCPGVVKGKNLSFAVGRAVSALADDSELGIAEAERRLIVMLNWFEQMNPRRWTGGERGTGQDWFGDSVQVFGGKSGMVSANGVSRDTATILAANLTQALDWEAVVIRRNTPAKRDEYDDDYGPPMSTNELRRNWEEHKAMTARKALDGVAA